MAEGDSVERKEEAEGASDNESESSGSEWAEWEDSEDDEILPFEVEEGEEANTPEAAAERFRKMMESEEVKIRERLEIETEEALEGVFDFPKDPERWSEKDLQELWADAPPQLKSPGWDPSLATQAEWQFVKSEMKQGRDPPIAPFYLPFRKYYPVVPEHNSNIKTPKAVIEELDRIEEFLIWVSYIFKDGSSYEGTVWDDLAHGKGVYVAEQGLVRYEGEWHRNMMDGHGVVEVDIPDVEPLPGSELEDIMRAEGKIIKRDYMTPEDREWLEMDMEDSYRLANGWSEIPFYENNAWVKLFGEKPEKGRYRYAGQWKQGRMHGCGVYEVNERPIIGRFYFGELVNEGPDNKKCDEDTSMLHAGIAEVAAAKARMFVNKPDGMVREERGPYSDPQHPYMYEEDDVWMAPGFINQFYEVPDNWKTYAHEVDEERQMWLNSFYKSPLRIPMPAELEHWWSKDAHPEFVILKKEPEPDPDDPSKLVYTEDPLILHTETGRLINFVEDEKHGVRLFWQPPLKEGEEVDPEKVEFLPLGFDEFYGLTDDDENKGGLLNRLRRAVGNVCSPVLEKLKTWTEAKKKASEMKLKLIEQELEFVEAELCLEEAIEDMEEDLEMKQKEEEKKMEMEQKDNKDTSDVIADQDGADSAENEEEEEEDDDAPTSFGSDLVDQDSTKNDQGNKPRKSPFATSSLLFSPSALVLTVPFKLQESFMSWKNRRGTTTLTPPISSSQKSTVPLEPSNSVSFPVVPAKSRSLKAVGHKHLMHHKTITRPSQLHSLSRILSTPQASSMMKILQGGLHQTQVTAPEETHCLCLQDILCLHVPIHCLENI